MACSPEERPRPHSSYDILRLTAGSFSKAFGEAASPTAGVGAGPAHISAPSRPSPGAGQGRAAAQELQGSPACPRSRLSALSQTWGSECEASLGEAALRGGRALLQGFSAS